MPVVTRKIQLVPQGDKEELNRVYTYLRDGMEVQSIMMNQCISAVYTAKMRGASNDEIKEIYKLCSHIPSSAKGSYYDFDMKKFPTGLPLAGGVPRQVKSALSEAMKKGLKYGCISLPTFKKDNPLYVHNDYCNILGKIKGDNSKLTNGFYHEYGSQEELEEALSSVRTPKIHIRFVNGINFDVILGDIGRSIELRKTLARCFSEEYQIGDSEICIKNKKIFLLLTVKMPAKSVTLDEKTVVGVDLGIAIPAVCALNNNAYVRKYIGSMDEFVAKRTKIATQRRNIQASLKYSKGGHGRAKKLKKLNDWSEYERNFAKQYNHYVSSNVVKFALKNRAKYINMEDLSGYGKDDRNSWVLRNWSYFELQNMIEYKAAKYGIIARKVRPAYTSQICSVCGKKGIRESQPTFLCSDPNCKSHEMYFVEKHKKAIFNADFNGARNIAKSTYFADDYKDIGVMEFIDSVDDKISTNTEYNHCLSRTIEEDGKKKDTEIVILCDDGKWNSFMLSAISKIIKKEKKEKKKKKAA